MYHLFVVFFTRVDLVGSCFSSFVLDSNYFGVHDVHTFWRARMALPPTEHEVPFQSVVLRALLATSSSN